MRIAFDYQCFQNQSHGGITRYILELISGLRNLEGVEVSGWIGLHQSDAEVPLPGIKVGKRWVENRNSGRVVRAINRVGFALWSRMSNSDIYHATFFRLLPAPRNSARVITVYDCIDELKLGAGYDIEYKRRALLSADHIICISQKTKDDVLTFYDVSPNKLSVVHLGSSMARFQAAHTRRLTERPYVLFVGQRGYYKNFRVLMAAFEDRELRSGVSIFCAGGSPVERTEISSGVVLEQESMPTDRRLADLYAEAVALVYPSRYEGFGLPLIEAMACGCPVITTRGGSIPEIAGDAALYFDPDDAPTLADLIKQVYSDHAMRGGLIARGYERAKSFSWSKCVAGTLEAYRKAVATTQS